MPSSLSKRRVKTVNLTVHLTVTTADSDNKGRRRQTNISPVRAQRENGRSSAGGRKERVHDIFCQGRSHVKCMVYTSQLSQFLASWQRECDTLPSKQAFAGS